MHSALDSYYSYVKAQLAIIDPSQRTGGVVMARDWPLSPPIEGALYLLYLSATPTNFSTQAQNHYEYFCQWSWILIGADIAQTQQAANRGDQTVLANKLIVVHHLK